MSSKRYKKQEVQQIILKRLSEYPKDYQDRYSSFMHFFYKLDITEEIYTQWATCTNSKNVNMIAIKQFREKIYARNRKFTLVDLALIQLLHKLKMSGYDISAPSFNDQQILINS